MTEPTSYDLIQDTRLDALEGVLADVTVPGEGEVSFPVAQQGMDTTMWQQLFRAFGTGVIDLGSFPYRLTSSDTPGSGTITIHPEGKGPAQAVIEGFFHRLPTAKTFTVPAVSTATTFTVALQYDPTQHKRPGGPITLGLFSGALDRTQGRKYVILWEGVRQPSTVVSQMTWVQKRHRVVPTIHVSSLSYLPDPNSDGLLWGTRALVGTGGEAIEYQLNGTTGNLRWESLSAPEWKKISRTGSMIEVLPTEWRIVGGSIELKGYCGPSSGTFSTTGSMMIGWISGIPLPDVNIPIACNGGRLGVLRTQVGGSGVRDNLIVDTPQGGTNRVSLDNIRLPLA